METNAFPPGRRRSLGNIAGYPAGAGRALPVPNIGQHGQKQIWLPCRPFFCVWGPGEAIQFRLQRIFFQDGPELLVPGPAPGQSHMDGVQIGIAVFVQQVGFDLGQPIGGQEQGLDFANQQVELVAGEIIPVLVFRPLLQIFPQVGQAGGGDKVLWCSSA